MELVATLNTAARTRLLAAVDAWSTLEGLSLAMKIRQAVGSRGASWSPHEWNEWVKSCSAVRLQVNRLTQLDPLLYDIRVIGPANPGKIIAEMEGFGGAVSWGDVRGMIQQGKDHFVGQLRPAERRLYNQILSEIRKAPYNPRFSLSSDTSWTQSTETLWQAQQALSRSAAPLSRS